MTIVEGGKFHGFDHIVFWVGNAKQAASFYSTRLGFEPVGYRGLETGHRDVATHVVKQDKIFFVFQSPLDPKETLINGHISKHGDGVRDVAFTVDNARLIFQVLSICYDKFNFIESC